MVLVAAVIVVTEEAPLGAAPNQSVQVNMTAFQALNGGAARPPRADNRHGFAAQPKYNKQRKLTTKDAEASYGEETELRINERYTLCITPLGKDEKNRIRVKARIDETIRKGNKTIKRKALETTSAVAPGKPLTLGGLKLKEGKLVVKLTLSE